MMKVREGGRVIDAIAFYSRCRVVELGEADEPDAVIVARGTLKKCGPTTWDRKRARASKHS